MIQNKIEAAISKKLSNKLEKFRDIHKGESCYIFGDGPSIKWFDLGSFQNLPSICSGLLPFHNDFGKLDVRYLLLVEPWLFVPGFFQPNIKSLKKFKKIVDEYKKIIKYYPGKEYFIHLSNYFSMRGENINYVFRGFPDIRNQTDAALKQFDLFNGSFHASLSLAYYFGFSKIYLVGFDGWTIQPSRALHWYELGEGLLFEPTNIALDFLKILKSNVEIYTITINNEYISRNVNAVSYEQLTGNPPKFKENHELLNENYINILATYPDYKIFTN